MGVMIYAFDQLTNDHVLTLIRSALNDEDASVREAAQRVSDRLKR